MLLYTVEITGTNYIYILKTETNPIALPLSQGGNLGLDNHFNFLNRLKNVFQFDFLLSSQENIIWQGEDNVFIYPPRKSQGAWKNRNKKK